MLRKGIFLNQAEEYLLGFIGVALLYYSYILNMPYLRGVKCFLVQQALFQASYNLKKVS